MAHAAAQLIVQCRVAFFNNDTAVREGELFYADDPLVKRFPEYFDAPKVRGSSVHAPLIVEQATAAPGQKRGA